MNMCGGPNTGAETRGGVFYIECLVFDFGVVSGVRSGLGGGGTAKWVPESSASGPVGTNS